MADEKKETPKNQSSLEQGNSTLWERCKYIVRGSFLGLCVGAIFSFVVPKDLIRRNKFLNHWIQPDNMTPNIYPASNSAVFAWVGGLIGSIAHIVRASRQPGTERVNKATLFTRHQSDIPKENEKTANFAKRIEQEKTAQATASSGQSH